MNSSYTGKTLKNVSYVDNTLRFITPFSQLHQPKKHSLRLCVAYNTQSVCVYVCAREQGAPVCHTESLSLSQEPVLPVISDNRNVLWSSFPISLTPNPATRFKIFPVAPYSSYELGSPEFQKIIAARIYETVFIVLQFRLSPEPKLSVWRSQCDGHY